MARFLAAILYLGALIFAFVFCADDRASATFPGSPGSTQFRAPAWRMPYVPAPLAAVGGIVTVDWRDGPWYQITLTGNVTFNPPVNVGANCIQIVIIQDATGSRTATWTNTTGGSGWKFAGGSATTLSTAAAAEDIATACPFKGGQANTAAISIGLNYK